MRLKIAAFSEVSARNSEIADGQRRSLCLTGEVAARKYKDRYARHDGP